MNAIAFLQPGPFEIIVILFIILLLFGAKRLPGLARSLGKSLQEFKRGKDEVVRELTSVQEDIDDDSSDYQNDIEVDEEYVDQSEQESQPKTDADQDKKAESSQA